LRGWPLKKRRRPKRDERSGRGLRQGGIGLVAGEAFLDRCGDLLFVLDTGDILG
jgi:hypothetical protein